MQTILLRCMYVATFSLRVHALAIARSAAVIMTKAAARGGDDATAGGVTRTKMTLGRQKIEIKRIASKEARQVCFSKRHFGLFKKAAELSALCGARVAVVLFTPAGRPFSLGHPSVHAVVDSFLDPSSADADAAAAAPVHPALLDEFNRESERLATALEAEARRREALDAAAGQAGVWTNADLMRAEMPELVAMLRELERVQAEAAGRAQEIIAAEEAMMPAAGTSDGSGVFHGYLGAGALAAEGGAGSHEAVVDTTMMLTSGNFGHPLAPAPPFAAMMPLLPPPPSFDHGFDYNLGAGYHFPDPLVFARDMGWS
ncbi:hypothetical protein ACP70R_036322 [Stipagrostis hirtigluma subsp. patula]